ncbi:hypothetical protein Dda_4753 [Drechslerella dactyloides]|uniref:Cupin type-2 domain-containing protein n=1 Tax=Drechslerella dactyloides TaxID=74499 RepID=A0AAD6NJI8_DREDA|nr:hypothetical protein Dda_4753 [Drechslerella dactyloides]
MPGDRAKPMASINPTVTITTHNPDGTAAIHPSSGPLAFTPIALAGQPCEMRAVYTTHTLPLVLDDDDDIKRHEAWIAAGTSRTPESGSLTVYYRFPPGAEIVMHRTESLDFGVVIDGEVELLLPGGETRLQRRGDVVIQRETMHRWRNPSLDKEALILFIAMSAKPVRVGDRVLGAEV